MIRKATAKDVKKINSIACNYKPNFNQVFCMETEVINPYAIILVYEQNKNILGFLYVLDALDNYDLMYIAVESNNLNKKIGSDLLEYFINNYAKPIMLEVRENNLVALKLYKKYNFKEINKRKAYYNGIDALVMRRD